MRYLLLWLLAALLIGIALAPIGFLVLAAGLPDMAVRPNGIQFETFSQWRGPRWDLLVEPANDVLWASLWRTLAVAFTVALAASSVAIVGAYLATRRGSVAVRRSAQALALTAYGLPSVFLLIAFYPLLTVLPIIPILKVSLLHFLYILPMSSILALGYALSHPYLLDRSAALDGAGWAARFALAYRANLWRGHLAVFAIGMLISWSDIVFSQQLLSGDSKLLVDLYVLRYFLGDSTFPDYSSAALFSLLLTGVAVALAFAVAYSNRKGA